MTDDHLNRETAERIRATIDGEPDSAWNGLSAATVYWVLTTRPGGGEIALSKNSGEAALTIQTAGGGADAAEITIDLTPEETGALGERKYYQEVVVVDAGGDPTTARLNPHVLWMKDTATAEVLDAAGGGV